LETPCLSALKSSGLLWVAVARRKMEARRRLLVAMAID